MNTRNIQKQARMYLYVILNLHLDYALIGYKPYKLGFERSVFSYKDEFRKGLYSCDVFTQMHRAIESYYETVE